MPAIYTPLRYPGGKAKFGPFLSAVFTVNRLIDAAYAEPYAGGAGAGLYLLFRGYANRFFLNDIDHGVTSFWRTVLTRGEQLARRVEATPLTVREWDRQKRCYEEGLNAGFDFAYAFFYLNRTNRSGIMNGGIIGGREQTGAWRIDARFNRADLAKRIRAVANFRRAISVTRMDALEFLESLETSKPKLLTYLDPPYFGKGEDLYTNYYKRADHVAIAARMRRFKLPWLMTYDDCAEIRRLYRRNRLFNSEVTYSASGASRGREIVVLGPGLKIPRDLPRPKRHDHRPGFELIV